MLVDSNGQFSSLVRLQSEGRGADLEAYTGFLTGLNSARSARPGDYLRSLRLVDEVECSRAFRIVRQGH